MFFDDIAKAFKFLIECFKMILEDPKLLFPSMLSVVFGFFMSLIVIVPFVLMGMMGKLGLYLFGGFALIALFISYAFTYFFAGASSFAIYEHVKYGKSSLGNAFNRAFSCILTLLMLAATAAVIKIIVNSLKNSGRNRRGSGVLLGFISSLAAGVINEGWEIAVSLLVPVAVISHLGYVDTFKKSFEIVKNNLVVIGAGEVGIRILDGVLGFLGVVIGIGLGIGLFLALTPFIGMFSLAVAIPVAFVFISLTATITQFIRTSYYTMVYIWAEEHMMHGQNGNTVAAPQAIQNAFGV
jgi:hypothetical protein